MPKAEDMMKSEDFRNGLAYAATLLRQTMREGLPELQADAGELHIKPCCADEVRQYAEGMAWGLEDEAGFKWEADDEAPIG